MSDAMKNDIDINRVKYMYLKYCLGTPEERVLTIARHYHSDTNEVTFAYALCCTKDQHNRKIGRQIALNRLQRPDIAKRISCGNKRAIDITMEEIAKLENGEESRDGFVSVGDIARAEIAKRNPSHHPV